MGTCASPKIPTRAVCMHIPLYKYFIYFIYVIKCFPLKILSHKNKKFRKSRWPESAIKTPPHLLPATNPPDPPFPSRRRRRFRTPDFFLIFSIFFEIFLASGAGADGGCGDGGEEMARTVEGDSESCGSRAAETAASPTHPRQQRAKMEVYNEVLRRLRESDSPDAAAPGFDDELWLHFSRLPARFFVLPRIEFSMFCCLFVCCWFRFCRGVFGMQVRSGCEC